MTKERQTQIMKPIKVLSLVLLALLLLIPAASAEIYTLIDEDLEFGGGLTFEGFSSYLPVFDDEVGEPVEIGICYEIYYDSYSIAESLGLTSPSELDGAHWSWGPYSGTVEYTGYNAGLEFDGFPDDVYTTVYGTSNINLKGWDYSEFDDSYEPEVYYAISYEDLFLAGLVPFVIGVVPESGVAGVITYTPDFYTEPFLITVPSGVTQHVTVTYDDETTDYTVTFDETTFDRDISVTGYLFGLFSIHSTGIGWKLHSDAVSYTVPARFLTFDLDYTAEVVYNGDRKSVSWNLDSLPETVTPPEPDPPYPDPDPELTDDPDLFDANSPFPKPSYNPSGLPNKIPTSLKEFIGLNLTEIRDKFKESTPFYSNAFDFIASAIETLFGFFLSLIVGTIGLLIGFLTDPLTDVYDFIVWTSSVVFSFMDFLIIPNHIMSVLADFVPVQIVNLALAALGFDILLNVLSIAIPDLITAYKSTVRTYYYKVDHGTKKGGKK